MSISVIFPFGYLLFGAIAAHIGFDFKSKLAALLSIYVIPAVVAYSVATSQSGLFVIIIGIMLAMLIGLVVSELFTRNKVTSLCFFYLNIGWLGLPVANAVFGDDAAQFFIAAYIGSSIFGNAVASGQLGDHAGLSTRIWRVVISPTALGLYAGLAARPFADVVTAHGEGLYGILKWSMSFLGMAILGMWLPSQSFRRTEFRRACRLYLIKTAFWLAMAAIAVALAASTGFSFVSKNAAAVGLMAFLPPAAAIIVLETHYSGTGQSSSLIVCETIISVIAIALYVGGLLLFHHVVGV